MKTLFKLLLTGLAVVLIEKLLPGVAVDSYSTAIWVAVALALLNIFVKPIFIIFTLPATIFTLGFFLLVINAVIILMASNLVDGFYVANFSTAFIFSLLLWLFRTILFKFIEDKDQKQLK